MSWKTVLGATDMPHRRTYCEELFGDDKFNLNRCLEPHAYCKYKCNEVINPIENIPNYHCYIDCTKASMRESVKGLNKKKELVNYLKYIPKVGDKCDYKPLGEKTFFSCLVKELTQVKKGNFAKITYSTPNLHNREVYVQYPTSSFLACGKGLTIRKDCGKTEI